MGLCRKCFCFEGTKERAEEGERMAERQRESEGGQESGGEEMEESNTYQQATSPCISNGYGVNPPSKDYTGRTRSATNPSMGAIEFVTYVLFSSPLLSSSPLRSLLSSSLLLFISFRFSFLVSFVSLYFVIIPSSLASQHPLLLLV